MTIEKPLGFLLNALLYPPMTLTCYYLDDSSADPRLPMTLGGPWTTPTSLPLGSSTGTFPYQATRGYHYHDFVTLNKETLGEALESVLDGFYEEHMHEFEEARYILSGHGYWDIRGKYLTHIRKFHNLSFSSEHPTETWIRFKVGPGDLVILPPGMFHRFTLDEKSDLSSMRMFLETPSRHALPRGKVADENPYRVDYLRTISVL
ncbi:1,2-dihydroxy-3-keto-5-methylthiopentene dioxygenase [Pisolithus tinctorius]|uniref:acireductone dioxygenase (Fe(2+)-requiring) n=1 Tax=Pisolithus tinctorius Marx 270 TaxID=870435 RepID=A0A0C3NJT8_PISTI|nr:1,2-dihydroxy-3-keto-5-methylthiopentene dioxygenase [Pisolithus tinctorius]KIN95915.1 hypothetical protein M404DRAFT_934327 [Pisolithus tinctorius Marx 270]